MSEPAIPSGAVAKAALASELLRRWDVMEPFVLVGLGGIGAVPLETDEVDVARTWVKVFDDEIEAVRQARDFTAHLPPELLPAEDLAQANELARRVTDALADRLPRFGDFLKDKDEFVSRGRRVGVVQTGFEASAPPAPPPPPASPRAPGAL